MGSVFVTNENDFPHQDRYDGEDFVFPPGVRVLISEEAARHMFGHGLINKSESLVRLGWATKHDPVAKTFVEDTEGVKKLANFVFDEAVMVSKSSLAAPAPTELEIA